MKNMELEALEGRRLLAAIPGVRLYVDVPSTSELGGAAPARITVVRDAAAATPLTVSYALGGTATNGADVQPLPGVVTIPAGARVASFDVTAVNDSAVEPAETLVVTLQPGNGYALGTLSSRTGRIFIADDDGLPTPTAVFPANDPSAFTFYGEGATRATVPAPGQPFASATRVTTTRPAGNSYDAQLLGAVTGAIRGGDTLLLRFQARNANPSAGPAKTEVVLERAGEPYTKSVTRGVTLDGGAWQSFTVPFTAAETYAAAGGSGLHATLNFRFGYGPQSVEVGGVSLVNYGGGVDVNKLTTTAANYQGRAGTDLAWRDAAAARIDQVRKADLTVRVVDAAGTPVGGATVHAAQTSLDFGVGTAVVAQRLNDPQQAQYQQIVRENFNKVVFENDLKWPAYQGDWGSRLGAAQAEAALAWLDANGIDDVRGHNLVWPGWREVPATAGQTSYKGIGFDMNPAKPASQEEYEAHVAADGAAAAKDWLRDRVRSHIAQEAGDPRFKGRLRDWDVVNETYANRDLQGVLGEGEVKAWYDAARAADPAARLFINDYPTADDTAHLDHYDRQIASLLAAGAPLGGIGFQGHFGPTLPGVDATRAMYQRFARFDLPIQVTEFDVWKVDEQTQADYLRDAMMLAFAEPSVDAFMLWGFWEQAHWRPEAALWRGNWSIKPNGQQFVDLVNSEWHTDATAATGGGGSTTLRGFKGDYDVDVTVGGQTYRRTATLGDGGATLIVTLPTVLDKTPPRVASAAFEYQTAPNAVRLTFDEPLKLAPTAADFSLSNVGGTAAAPTYTVGYDAAARAATVRFSTVPPDGNWRLTLGKSALVDAAGNAAGADYSFDFFTLAGDADRNRNVGQSDYDILGRNFGRRGGVTFGQGDFNYDGRVDLLDYAILRGHFGGSLPPPIFASVFGGTRIGGGGDDAGPAGFIGDGSGGSTVA